MKVFVLMVLGDYLVNGNLNHFGSVFDAYLLLIMMGYSNGNEYIAAISCTGTRELIPGIRQVDPSSLIRLTWELQRRVTNNGKSIYGCLYIKL